MRPQQFVLFLLVPALAVAQDTRGTIAGTLADPQGAAIASAAIVVVNRDTGTSVRLVTNASGYYEAPLLIPGNYSVTAESPGFKKLVRSGIVLALGEQLQINLEMEVGSTSESVTVLAEAPMLDTSSVSSGRSISNREIMDLPVLANNVSMLARFSPGVQVPGTTQFLVQGQVGGGSAYSMPGGVGGNEWSLDGGSTNGANRRSTFMPGPDVIGEFRLETSNFDASFGHSTGLNISMATKSGGNAFHGSATYQYFNQRWNAASFFVKQNFYRRIAQARAAGDEARADALARTPMLPPGHTNNAHGTISGPITIPKVVDGKNKLFFFLGYSILRNRQVARPNEINYTVPTMPMRTGDFSQLLRVDPVQYQVYDPLTTRPDPARPGHVIRSPFSGNIIPISRFRNPIYDFYTKRLPTPNNNPVNPLIEPFNNYLASSMPNNVEFGSWNGRIDHHASDRHRFFFRFLTSSFLEDAQDYTFETEKGLMEFDERERTLSGIADWTFTMNANTVMNVSVDATRFQTQQQRLGTRKYKPTDVGLPAYMDQKCASGCVLPRVVWPGMTAWSGDMVLGVPLDPGPQRRQQAIKFNLTHVRNAHTIRAGIDFRQRYATQQNPGGGLTSGNFAFANTFVRRDEDGFQPAGGYGLSWASFLLGMPSGISVDTNDSFALMNPYYAWYGQDTWRITRKLTVTLGLRFEYELGPTERFNRALSYFDPNVELPIGAAAQAAYARNPLPELPANQFIVRGGTVYAGRNGVSRRLWRNELMVLPRFSAAYQVTPKTVIRGGFGVFFDTLNVMNQLADQSGFSRPTSTILTNDFGQTWLAGNPLAGISPLTDPFPIRADGTRFDLPLRDALGPMARVGQGVNYTPFDRMHPRVQRWRLSIQRELARNLLVEASYWGQWADRVGLAVREDYLPAQYWNQTSTRNNAIATEMNRQVPNPFYIENFASLRSTNPVLYQHMSTLDQFRAPTIAKNRLLRPFAHMNGLNNTAVPVGIARTNAMELNLQRRFANGFNVNASYTRMIQHNKTFIDNEFDRGPVTWWTSDTARPHRLTATGIFELPFGKGRAYFQTGFLKQILGGWQTAVTFEYQPGPLLAWGNLFYRGDTSAFERDATSGSKTLDRWFNTEVPFERLAANQPAAFQARVFPRFFDGLRADGLKQWNGNLMREFRIREALRMQFRADAVNLQNRSQMSAPDINPVSTNFGRVLSQTASLNRFYQLQVRLQF